MEIKQRLKELIKDYTGRPVRSLRCVADPEVSGVWAVRAQVRGIGRLDLLVNVPEGEDGIEEVEWGSWPPAPAGNRLNVFNI